MEVGTDPAPLHPALHPGQGPGPTLPVLAATLPEAPQCPRGTAGKAHTAPETADSPSPRPGTSPPPALKHNFFAKETMLEGQTILPRLQDLRCGLGFFFSFFFLIFFSSFLFQEEWFSLAPMGGVWPTVWPWQDVAQLPTRRHRPGRAAAPAPGAGGGPLAPQAAGPEAVIVWVTGPEARAHAT